MIPEALEKKLLHELLPHGNASTQTTRLKGQLCALVDMAIITEEQRQEIRHHFKDRLYPLITESGLEDLTPLSATLIQAPATDLQGQHDLIYSLERYNSDVVSVWITSTLPTPELAIHLRQATFAYEEKLGAFEQKQTQRYLLRYYDPLITPILYGEAPDLWQKWLFGPIMSWWFAQPSSKEEQWFEMVGYKKNTASISAAPRLIITQTLMQKLEKDTLPYQLLNEFEAKVPTVFAHECRGIRLAQIKDFLAQAQSLGIKTPHSIIDYVYFSLKHTPQVLQRHPNWQAALNETVLRNGRLSELFRFEI